MVSNQLIYISGGCRSGKSAYAQHLAEGLPGKRVYLATCPRIDEEMETRINLHRQQRENQGWETIEASLELTTAVEALRDFDVILIDCLTLWVNNLLFDAELRNENFSEEQMSRYSNELMDVCRKGSQTILFVSNELGMGLVPVDATSRRYRDCLGRCNQIVARAADKAIFMVSGIPLNLKEVETKHECTE